MSGYILVHMTCTHKLLQRILHEGTTHTTSETFSPEIVQIQLSLVTNKTVSMLTVSHISFLGNPSSTSSGIGHDLCNLPNVLYILMKSVLDSMLFIQLSPSPKTAVFI